MNEFYKNISFDKILLAGFTSSFLCVLVSLLVIGIFYTKLPPFIPLFNQMPWGEGRIATRDQLFIPASFAIIFICANILFSTVFYEKMPLISRILSLTTIITSALTLLVTIRTILITL